MVTRSGTNQLHGAGFETFRSNAEGLRARQRQDGNTSAKYIRNEYGGYLAGPVWIPKLYNGKNKTFWFFDYEGLKLRQNQFAITAVPTASMWNGDLSSITDTSGDRFTIYDPGTTGPNGVRSPFPNNVIPANRISQTAKTFQTVTPTPKVPAIAAPTSHSAVPRRAGGSEIALALALVLTLALAVPPGIVSTFAGTIMPLDNGVMRSPPADGSDPSARNAAALLIDDAVESPRRMPSNREPRARIRASLRRSISDRISCVIRVDDIASLCSRANSSSASCSACAVG